MKKRTSPRKGALLSFELLVVIPVLLGLIMACIEFSLLMSGNQKLKEASRQVARICSRPMTNSEARESAIRRALAATLRKPAMIKRCEVQIDSGHFTGETVKVQLKLPMKTAAPDLLRCLGFSLDNRHLVAISVMQHE